MRMEENKEKVLQAEEEKEELDEVNGGIGIGPVFTPTMLRCPECGEMFQYGTLHKCNDLELDR